MAIGAEGESESTDALLAPPEHVAADEGSPSTSESAPPEAAAPEAAAPEAPRGPREAPREPRDRGRTIALGTLGGLLALGVVLIARGSQGPTGQPSTASSAPAILTSADVPASDAAPPSAALAAPASLAATQPDAGPKFVPTWRVAALEHETGVEILRGTLGKHTLAGALAQAGIPKLEIRRVTHSVDNIRRIERGVVEGLASSSRVIARRAPSSRSSTSLRRPTSGRLADDDTLVTKKLELFVEKKRTQTSLVVTADLAKAIAAAGLHEEAIEEIDDALEGHGDAAVIKPGVRLRVVGHEEWVEGAFARFHVDAIDYVPKTGEHLRVYHYERDASVEGNHRRSPHPGFYDAKGQQPFRGTFRSPLPLARITSRFNPKRMHPVLHVVMPHNGIDFGASSGTPVYASATGTIAQRRRRRPVREHGADRARQRPHDRLLPSLAVRARAASRPARRGATARRLRRADGARDGPAPPLRGEARRDLHRSDGPQDGRRSHASAADREAFAKKRAELDAALEAVALPAADGTVVRRQGRPKDEPAGEE